MESPYDVLRIDTDADEDEVKAAYKRRIKESHPDHGGSAAEFRLVRNAYETLTANDRGEHPATLEQSRRTPARVEYLNYEVLDDHGWSLDDPFEQVPADGLDTTDHGQLLVEPAELLLEAAERCGFAWPYACRGGACANCAVVVLEGELSTPVDHILPPAMIERGIRLSCVGTPVTDDVTVVYNVKHLPELDELRLPPRPFEQAYADE